MSETPKEKHLIQKKAKIESKFETYLRRFLKVLPKKVSLNLLSLYFYLKDSPDHILKKSAAIMALIYFITPIDVVPDAIPFSGFLDDAVIVAWAVRYYGEKIKPFEAAAKKWLEQS